ncbi:MAG: hypothetical protein AAGA30_00450 [Planctomycetota bacterium]
MSISKPPEFAISVNGIVLSRFARVEGDRFSVIAPQPKVHKVIGRDLFSNTDNARWPHARVRTNSTQRKVKILGSTQSIKSLRLDKRDLRPTASAGRFEGSKQPTLGLFTYVFIRHQIRKRATD